MHRYKTYRGLGGSGSSRGGDGFRSRSRGRVEISCQGVVLKPQLLHALQARKRQARQSPNHGSRVAQSLYADVDTSH